MTKPSPQVLRIQLVVAFLCVALVVYFWIMGRSGVILMKSGEPAAIGLGIGIFVLPLIGLWAMVATLRAGFAHQRLARLAYEEGVELDVSDLPKRPSGRIERDAADALFESVRDEVEARPDDWRVWYRLARAYDYAGDRTRARETIRKAVRLEQASR
ncbi:TPR repeat-containing protein [Mycobacteroides abscessus subsp. abscessus]|nr:TPR repeat-containing protein [Mycobacteroides abscessus subsp. abscessus]